MEARYESTEVKWARKNGGLPEPEKWNEGWRKAVWSQTSVLGFKKLASYWLCLFYKPLS